MRFPFRFLVLGAVVALAGCGASDRLFTGSESGRRARLADAALAGGLPQAALSATRAALERDPFDVPALLRQGEALSAMGRQDAAAEAYRRALSAEASANQEQVKQAQLGLGRADLAAGRAEEAEKAFRAMLAAAPNEPRSRDGLGIALDMQGRHREAQEEYRAALAQGGAEGVRVNLGLSLAMAGDAAGALAMLRPFAEDPAASSRVRHNLAFAMALAGDAKGAERILAHDMPREQVVAALSGFSALKQP